MLGRPLPVYYAGYMSEKECVHRWNNVVRGAPRKQGEFGENQGWKNAVQDIRTSIRARYINVQFFNILIYAIKRGENVNAKIGDMLLTLRIFL